MSNIKVICGSAAKSQEYSKSSSKKLFQSVFKMLDHDEQQVSSFDQNDTNGSRINNILANNDFKQALIHKIRSQGLFDTYPILKTSCFDKNDINQKLDTQDVQAVFQKFGNLFQVYTLPDQLSCYIFFTSFSSAYVAMKLLNGFTIRFSLAQLYVTWCSHHQYEHFSSLLADYHSNVDWNIDNFSHQQKYPQSQNSGNQKQNKLTCRYDIQIQNQKDFQVARRIIGAKGINMKKIIEAAIDAYSEQQKANSNNNQILKLRLRGKGSGYKQGPDQLESEESLHLCISAKDQLIYNHACQSVEKLLQGVYTEYQDYTRKSTNQIISLKVKKIDMGTQNNTNDAKNLTLQSGRMQPYKIQQFLQLRNKARRQLNFAEADRIRNYLRSCGVCLIDQKGKRGKATQVTTWKYLL